MSITRIHLKPTRRQATRHVLAIAAAFVSLVVSPWVSSGRAQSRPLPDSPPEGEVRAYQTDYDVSYAEAFRRLSVQRLGFDLVDALQTRLGGQFAGIWFDNDSGRFKIATTRSTNETAARAVAVERGLSADADLIPVESTWAELQASQVELNSRLRGSIQRQHVTTALDPSANAVVVNVSDRAGTDERERVSAEADRQPVSVEVRTVPGRMLEITAVACAYPFCDRPLRGGVEITHTDGAACSAGFRAFRNTTPYMLTAGHCGSGTWSTRSPSAGSTQPIGSVAFGYNDYQLDAEAIATTGGYWDNATGGVTIAAWTVNENYPINGTASNFVGHTAAEQDGPHPCGVER